MNAKSALTAEPYSWRKDFATVFSIPPPGTLFFVVLTILGFCLQLYVGIQTVNQWFGIVPSNLMNVSQWLRIHDQLVPVWMTAFTYLYFHGGWSHIIANLFGLWFFGIYAEKLIGTKTFVLLYIVTGAIGAFAVASQVPGNPDAISGASSSIGGILAAYWFVCVSPWMKHYWISVLAHSAEIACIAFIILWYTFRTVPAQPDIFCSLMWHFIPFLAGWIMMRLFSFINPNNI